MAEELFVTKFRLNRQSVSPQLEHPTGVGLEIVTLNVLVAFQLVPYPESKKTVRPPKAHAQRRPDFCGGCAVPEL